MTGDRKKLFLDYSRNSDIICIADFSVICGTEALQED